MFCESCGSFIPDGQSFCSNCGTPVTNQAPAQEAAPAPAPAPAGDEFMSIPEGIDEELPFS